MPPSSSKHASRGPKSVGGCRQREQRKSRQSRDEMSFLSTAIDGGYVDMDPVIALLMLIASLHHIS